LKKNFIFLGFLNIIILFKYFYTILTKKKSAIISETSQLDLSNLILPNVVIGPKTQIGSFCKILTGSTIAHQY
jgi:NDP-sugar pyrophosphorylase family protein